MKIIKVKLFILINLVLLLLACQKDKNLGQINSVQGIINPSELGFSLTHEHIMSNFGKDINETSNYDSIKLQNQVIPYLKKIKSLGVSSIFDCTTDFFGRRVDLLKKISDSTGVQIITNTGFYGAAKDRYIPELAYKESSESISKIWIDEFKNGINGTKIKPGFIKLAFDDSAPSVIDKKLFEAGILAHLATGLTIAVHTGNNIEAMKFQIDLLDKYNVDASAWIWTHAHKVEDNNILFNSAAKGAWISLDGVKESNTIEYIERVKLFKQKNLLSKVLLSHDGNGLPKGGPTRKFEAISKNLIPAMLENGFTKDDINQIFLKNPLEAFCIRIRKK